MPTKRAIASELVAELRPAPITAAWIREGEPVARCATLSNSEDGTATTVLWDCTEGKFEWIYDFDETIYFLEGRVIIDDGHAGPRQFGPGDVIFFPAGARANWHVQEHVKKLAFCRQVLPAPIGFVVSALRFLKRKMRVPSAGVSALSTG